MEQRAPQLQGGGVEGDGGDEEERLVRAQVRVVDTEDGAQHALVWRADTLGPARGARGEVDVREALGQRGLRRRGRGLAFQGHLSQHDGGQVFGGQLREQLARGEEHRGACVLQHGGEALAGVRGVQRHVGAAGLEDGDEGDNQLQRALQGDGHARVGGDAQAAQVVCELVGPLIELPVGELRGSELAGELDGDLVGEAGDDLREDVGQGGAVRVLGDGGIPVHQHLPALRLGEHGDGRQGRLGPVDERLHQHSEVLRNSSRRGGLEQIGVVPQHPLVALRRLSQVQLQLEPGREVVHLQLPQRQPLHCRRGHGGVLQGEEHLEERAATQVARGLERLHQLLEGHVLVGVRTEGRLLDLTQQVAERHAGVHLGAQHQRVDEEADEPLQLTPVAPGDGRADADVLLPGVAGEQHLEGGQQGHEGGGPLLMAERLECLGHGTREGDDDLVAPEGAHGRARPVGG